jgi:hypothetical protein
MKKWIPNKVFSIADVFTHPTPPTPPYAPSHLRPRETIEGTTTLGAYTSLEMSL